jgi:hypothetical protein
MAIVGFALQANKESRELPCLAHYETANQPLHRQVGEHGVPATCQP